MPENMHRRGFLRWSAGAAGATAVATVAQPAAAAPTWSPRPFHKPKGAIVASREGGWNPADTTATLQSAINKALDQTHQRDTTLLIDRQDGDWVTGPLVIGFDPDHPKGAHKLTVVIEPGTVLRAKAGLFDGNPLIFDTVDVCLITIAGPATGELVSDIAIIGYGATLAMNKTEYNAGEWRHALSILSCDKISVSGLTLRDSGGDGIYLGVRYDRPRRKAIGQPYCSAIELRNVRCDNHRRNGMTVISVDGLTVESCAFTGTFGTPPMAGICFEPDPARTTSQPYELLPYSRLKNIVIRDTAIRDNVGQAVTINALCLGGAEPECGPIGIRFENVMFGATTAADLGTFICSVAGDNGDPTPREKGGIGTGSVPPGEVSIVDSLIDSRLFAAAIRTQAMPAGTDFRLTFTRTAIWNDAYSRPGKFQPIALVAVAGPDIARKYGGVTWTDCVINSNQRNPILAGYPVAGDAQSACAGLSGNLTAYLPVPTGSPTLNVPAAGNTLTIEQFQAPNVKDSTTPMPSVSVAASAGQARPGDAVTLTFSRAGGDNTRTMAVAYSTTGTAEERYDYDGLSGVAIFKPNETTTKVTLRTRRPDRGADTRTVILEILHSDAYKFDPATRTATVSIR
ncbi:hypothetical protein [Nonomuraea angiospora]|uniref:hypothetical protein n=1 Tax=Nonomuraea angiospora TaxID=46172 RepID=UPI0029B75322|nr:hypothetical protein [Nonomuraea angiospora]MDX3104618.1 hypothetical protein [Nonomuraea angiospora]